MKVFLSRIPLADPPKLIAIPNGLTILGRGDLLEIDDKKLSRCQATIDVNLEAQTVFVSLKGVNPSSVIRKSGRIEPLPKDETSLSVENGDAIMLLPNKHKFYVFIENEMQLNDEPKNEIGVLQREKEKEKETVEKLENPRELEKKGQVEREEDDEQEQEEEIINNRPHCKYGEKCYRQNPQHLKEFQHPKKMTPTSNSPTKPTPTHTQTNKPTTPPKPAITKSQSNLSSQTTTSTQPNKPITDLTLDKPVTTTTTTLSRTKSIDDLSTKVLQHSLLPKSTKRTIEEEEENEYKKPKTEPPKMEPPKANMSFSDKKDKPSIPPTNNNNNNNNNNSNKTNGNPNTNSTMKKSDSFSLMFDQDSSDDNKNDNNKSNNDEQKKKSNPPKIFSPPKVTPPQLQKTSNLPPSSLPIQHPKTGIHTLIFPLVSTTHNNFDTSKALSIAATCIEDFFQTNHSPNVKLLMVVYPSLFETVFVELQKDFPDLTMNPSLRLISADNVLSALDQIRDDKSQKVLAVETTWRLKEIPINKYIYMADPQISVLTKRFYPNPGKLSEVYPIELANTSALNSVHNVDCLFWIIGPNLNPSKPDFIEDYNAGCVALKKTYQNMFKRFCEFIA